MFLELIKVGMFLFVFTVTLNMAEAYFPLFWHLCGKWAVGPPGKGQRHFKCIECKVQTRSNMFLELIKVGIFLFVFTVPLNMAEAYFPLFWHLCGKWAIGPPWEGSEANKCIECKVQTTSNMFLELTKVGMFLFVFTVPLNMAEAYFPLFWHLCGKWAVGPPWEGSEAF